MVVAAMVVVVIIIIDNFCIALFSGVKVVVVMLLMVIIIAWSRSEYNFACLPYYLELCLSNVRPPASFHFIFLPIFFQYKATCARAVSQTFDCHVMK